MNKIRWGILATGNIANSMAQALNDCPDADLVAVASRSPEKAQTFAQKWRIPKAYAAYEELAADPDIDVVYIATPHSHHYINMRWCLRMNKHVLCEKAFTLSAEQASECIDLAREKGVFLMEAMWMRFFPAMAAVRAWLHQGLIGDVRLVQADFCVKLPANPQHRLNNPSLGGGALLDLGVYPISLASMILGLPIAVHGHAHLGPTGVDELDTIQLSYAGGALASLTCSSRIHKPREAFIIGTQGHIKIHDVFFQPDVVSLHIDDQEPETHTFPFESNGYVHEVYEVHRCLRNGQTESALMPLDETLAIMQIMDSLRIQWGVHYPSE